MGEKKRAWDGARCRTVVVALALAVVGTPVGSTWAQEEAKNKARALYDEGTTKYNLGQWDEAVAKFTEAYETYPAPAFLFNLGQAYRQWGNCKQSLFFYRRYLGVQPDAKNRQEVEGFIESLTARCKDEPVVVKPTEPAPARAPESPKPSTSGNAANPQTVVQPNPSSGPSAGLASSTADVEAAEVVAGDSATATRNAQATVFSGRVLLGPAFVGLADDLDVGAQIGFHIGGAYPLALGPGALELGGAFGFTPIPWESADESQSGTSTLVGFWAQVGYRLPVAGKFALGGEFGLGVGLLAGLSDQAAEVFLEPGMRATGAISMPGARFAVSAEFDMTQNLVAVLQPAWQVLGAKEGLRRNPGTMENPEGTLNGVTNFQVLLGIGYHK